MPLIVEEERTPNGYRFPHFTIEGSLSVDEARQLLELTNSGGKYDNWAFMGHLADGAQIPPESRKLLASAKFRNQPVAAVAKSAAVRVLVNFMGKFIGVDKMRMHGSVDEAKAYLDEAIPKGWENAPAEQTQSRA